MTRVVVIFFSSKLRLTLIYVAGQETKNGVPRYSIILHVLVPIFSVTVFFYTYYVLCRRARKNIKYHRENCNVELKTIFI